MTEQKKLSKDISTITGNSARQIYEQSQAKIRSGELDPTLALSRKNQISAPYDYLYVLPGFNLREKLNPKRIRRYADLYKKGAKMPALVVFAKSGRFMVIDGHHRYEAIGLAISEGALIERVEIIEFDGSEADALIFMYDAADGERLTAIEKAKGYQRLLDQGLTLEEIAIARDQSQLQIKQMLMLWNAPEVIKDAVRANKVSATAVIHLLIECQRNKTDPVEIIAASIEKAAAAGKTKATAKTFRETVNKPRPLPKKHVTAAIGSLMQSSITTQLRTALPAIEDGTQGSKEPISITLPADVGRDLLAALEQLEKAKERQAEKDLPGDDNSNDSSNTDASPGQTE